MTGKAVEFPVMLDAERAKYVQREVEYEEAIKALQQQPAGNHPETKHRKTASSTHSGNITQPEHQLTKANAETERPKAEHATAYKPVDYRQKKCAATQMVDLQRRDALALADGAFEECKDYPITHDAVIEALAIPQDTSALEAIVQKAGEVMRERCAKDCEAWESEPVSHATAANSIRALTGVTLEDLKNG